MRNWKEITKLRSQMSIVVVSDKGLRLHHTSHVVMSVDSANLEQDLHAYQQLAGKQISQKGNLLFVLPGPWRLFQHTPCSTSIASNPFSNCIKQNLYCIYSS